ncbi:hypothetical protein BJ322DRAFT_1155953 [Thelephora terrestris]|uniref:Glutathione S-transferase UstS-like C-terminal domain-containing protein n=1 Tax=Thelephora terrestris TaxID=56493 RepID=A0A9P6L547_9AGAM|nr:hypothetical protein BJ322DRAFT_1155953 [Thelephora terrestris]
MGYPIDNPKFFWVDYRHPHSTHPHFSSRVISGRWRESRRSSGNAVLCAPCRERCLGRPHRLAFNKELREADLGDTLVNIAKDPQSHWDAYKDAFSSVALPVYGKAEGIFLRGNEPGWADFMTASALLSIKLSYGVDSKDRKSIETWDNGRWIKLIKDLEPYAHIDGRDGRNAGASSRIELLWLRL